MQEFDKLFFRLSNLSGVRGTAPAARQTTAVFFWILAVAPMNEHHVTAARFAGTHSCATSGTL